MIISPENIKIKKLKAFRPIVISVTNLIFIRQDRKYFANRESGRNKQWPFRNKMVHSYYLVLVISNTDHV